MGPAWLLPALATGSRSGRRTFVSRVWGRASRPEHDSQGDGSRQTLTRLAEGQDVYGKNVVRVSSFGAYVSPSSNPFGRTDADTSAVA